MLSFDPPRVFTGGVEDYLVLGVALAATALAQVFLVQRNHHPENVHSPPLAWMRAGLYFSVVLIVSWATGVLKVLAHAPLIAPGNLQRTGWLVLTGIWVMLTVWGYAYWWPRGTLTHGRRLYLLPQSLFGLVWGLCAGQVALIMWAIVEEFGFARWLTALLVFVLLSGYGQVYQSGWWDIHVSPPHNRRATNARKVLFAHMPFIITALVHFTLFGEARVFVLFHGVALGCSAVAMRFPPFWAPDGPAVSRETAIGV